MNYIFPPQPTVSLPIVGSQARFPVHRVYCVSQNYADHVKEMGEDTRNPPCFFSKPADSLVSEGGTVSYPSMTQDFHHEVELVVALGKSGKQLSKEQAMDCIFGYAVGFDLTRRDLQSEAKSKGYPWEMSKGFDEGAPISAIMPAERCGHLKSRIIWLKCNGALRQNGNISQMIWDVGEIIANLSSFVSLKAGDLIFTGTPAGVPVAVRGDCIEGGIEGVGELSVKVI